MADELPDISIPGGNGGIDGNGLVAGPGHHLGVASVMSLRMGFYKKLDPRQAGSDNAGVSSA
jgi:hypothetical protein